MRIYRDGVGIELTEAEVEQAHDDYEFRSDVAMVNDRLEEYVDDSFSDVELSALNKAQRTELVERVASLWRCRVDKADWSEMNDFESELLAEAVKDVLEGERDGWMNLPVREGGAER